jgi:hypothetical protein
VGGFNMEELSNHSIEDFKKEILRRNKKNRKLVINEIKKHYNDIKLNSRSGLASGKYEYDFLWLDGIYAGKNFRICFYYQDIDTDSCNVHIFHGKYTLECDLVNNCKIGPASIFNINKSGRDVFLDASKKLGYSTQDADNFDIEVFLNELCSFIGYQR